MSEEQDSEAAMTGATVYQRLRQEILSCRLRPGVQVRERQIADRYGVSKSPVRDALIKLQEQNLVEVMPRKGYRVARISLADARELYEMRMIYERESISRLVEFADDETLAGLDAFRKAPLDGPLDDWIAYNRRFHSYLAQNCGNSRLARSAVEVIEQFDRLSFMSVSSGKELGLEKRTAEHGVIIDAIQSSEKRRAITLLRDHLEISRRRLLDALESAPIVL